MVCEMTQLEERKKKLKKKLFKRPTLLFFVLPPPLPGHPPIFIISTSSDLRALILVSKVAEHQSLYLTS